MTIQAKAVLLRSIGICIGVLLAATSVGHLLDPYRFLHSVLNYRLVSGVYAQWIAIFIPWAQIFAGIALIIGVCRKGALGMGALLFTVFFLAQFSALVRGLDINCGCFGSGDHPVSWQGSIGLISLIVICLATLLGELAGPGRRQIESCSRHNSEVEQPNEHRVIAKRHGLSLVELILVVAIISLLFGMLLPAIQSSREAARNLACQNRLRQLGLSGSQYESANSRLPIGTLGFASPYVFQGLEDLDWQNPSSERFWKLAQHTSVWVQLLPYLEQSPLYDQLPSILYNSNQTYAQYIQANPGAPHWIGLLVEEQSKTQLSIFLCPSDNVSGYQFKGALAAIATQPSYSSSLHSDVFLPELGSFLLEQPAASSYAANVGAHSAGGGTGNRPVGYSGPFTSRRSIRLASVRDGQSNTVFFGESLGAIEKRKRTIFHSWMFGGLVRGRGALAWQANMSPENAEFLLFGDAEWAHPGGFGSLHPMGVNVAFGDGSVRQLSRMTHHELMYNLCGIADGQVIVPD